MKILLSFVIVLTFSAVGLAQTVNKPVKIKKKPQPEYRGRNCSEPAGQAVLEVTFDKTSKIGAVNIIKSSGCTEFDEGAMRAADKITFDPAVKNGEAETVTKRLVYKYRIY